MDPVVAIIVAVVGPLGAYLVAARRFSGKVETTEAKDLWKEAGRIREWSSARITALEARIEALEETGDELQRRNTELNRKVIDLTGEVAACRRENQALTADLETAQGLVEELRK